ncbi:sigma 54-interacting transcriptional regulator [Desulforhopalus singaporensis]|uniref:Transcriptional regulator containing GAF, AAA-type ATPase, and DNA-binding Fis domains n=1 Tax=Desulforhopalus singaporensis TaxID=91360 RepID=A0A1H0VZ97_9BACT|nr:sigma 54-interacting transcriptional regulator [Desulforhopalus singaporensis]SDP83772.1 Transcriptional regulator containing GAF, AAA-type ATPase, and DNA-binding Fis domains [Desulforhopalus singaporensis]
MNLKYSEQSKNFLEDNYRFEMFLSEMATKFIDLPVNQVREEIEKGLRLIVEYLKIDRCSLLKFSTDGTRLLPANSYTIPAAQSPLAKNFSFKMPSYIAKLRKGERVFVSQPEDVPEEWVLEKKYMKKMGIKAHLGLPLKVGDDVVGVLTFDVFRSASDWPQVLLEKLSYLSMIFGNVLMREGIYNQIDRALGFEELLSEISTRFLNLPVKAIDTNIKAALQKLVEFLDMDRSTLYQLNIEKSNFFLTHFWSRSGIENMPSLSGRDFPWMENKLRKGDILTYSSIEDLPAEAEHDKKILMSVGDKSILVIPLMASGTLIGALSFSSIRNKKVLPDKIVQRCRLIGEIFSSTLTRVESALALIEAFSKIKHLKAQLESDYNYLRDELDSEFGFHEMIGKSAPLQHVLFKIEQVAPTDTTVLILGETGTGKELVARAIHNKSTRKNRPLVKVNCAALSPMLIESELFGHEKGAFTGAYKRKPGRFETAHGTSFFLDEIGELPLDLQAKLLRVIQDGELERIGGTGTIKVEVRIIAATNKDLYNEVREGRFRQDLYYRLNVFPITVPPLRQRTDDIPLLLNWFVQKFTKKLGKKITGISKDVIAKLQGYQWPGNVRELENTVERAVINNNGPMLRMRDVSGAVEFNQIKAGNEETFIDNDELLSTPQRTTLSELERNYIIQVLKENNWRIDGPKGAALILGLKTSTLRSRMKKLGIRRPSTPQ